MEPPEDSLRLVLISLNEPKQVAVLALAEHFGPQVFSLGVIKGKEQLEALLELAAVDHYVVAYAEPFAAIFKPAPFRHTASQIVEGLEQSFRGASQLCERRGAGEELTDEERSQIRFLPQSWLDDLVQFSAYRGGAGTHTGLV